jgi:type I site-specific restriction endonuclease
MINQTPEQIAWDKIDRMLASAGWAVQSKNKVDFSTAKGVAVREYQTDILLQDQYSSHPEKIHHAAGRSAGLH